MRGEDDRIALREEIVLICDDRFLYDGILCSDLREDRAGRPLTTFKYLCLSLSPCMESMDVIEGECCLASKLDDHQARSGEIG